MSNKQTIKIQVIGATASGKSTISREIYYHLKQIGFEIDLTYDDESEIFEMPTSERLIATIKKSKISIKTVQINSDFEEPRKQFSQAELDMLDMIDEDYKNRIK